ncbi:hypothetical protein ABEU20_002618 [Rhodococcus sp. PAM 2766]|uniref:MarR family transcriptional regulator n=1 Tax=Rhodococcus parequi TaxID=3137122 RepID=A0ABW9FER3_9NOCA
MSNTYDFVEVLAREAGMTRKQVLKGLEELEAHNLITPLTPDRDWSVGVWMNTHQRFSGVSLD